jgi:hypothetical protein
MTGDMPGSHPDLKLTYMLFGTDLDKILIKSNQIKIF